VKAKLVPQTPAAPRHTVSWPEHVVTAAVGLVALGLVVAQMRASSNSGDRPTLSMLDQRVAMLKKVKDPIKRDSLCVPLSAYGRALDKAIAKDANVFFAGLVGKTNGGKLGYYYFLQNFLFPRRLELSFGTNATFHCEYFDGVDCESADQLRTNGFDLLIKYGAQGLQLVPLTDKGVPHE
jgi:hypothetical protein